MRVRRDFRGVSRISSLDGMKSVSYRGRKRPEKAGALGRALPPRAHPIAADSPAGGVVVATFITHDQIFHERSAD